MNVEVGQVWADNDSRSVGRTIRVDAIDGAKATCTIITNSDDTQQYVDGVKVRAAYEQNAYKDRRGQKVKIAIKRFKPTSTGYRLESES